MTATERNSSATATFLKENPVNSLPSLTEGMFGYSLTRTVHNKDYYYGIFDACEKFGCSIEGWHTESGPGVYEAVSNEFDLPKGRLLHILTPLNSQALEFGEIKQMADKASLFKSVILN